MLTDCIVCCVKVWAAKRVWISFVLDVTRAGCAYMHPTGNDPVSLCRTSTGDCVDFRGRELTPYTCFLFTPHSVVARQPGWLKEINRNCLTIQTWGPCLARPVMHAVGSPRFRVGGPEPARNPTRNPPVVLTFTPSQRPDWGKDPIWAQPKLHTLEVEIKRGVKIIVSQAHVCKGRKRVREGMEWTELHLVVG